MTGFTKGEGKTDAKRQSGDDQSTQYSPSGRTVIPIVAEGTSRRQVLSAGVAVGIGLGVGQLPTASAAKPPERMRPQPGDPIVHRFGDRKGEAVKPDDVPEGKLLLQAVSKDPESGKLRDASRLNGLNLVRIDETTLDEKTAQFATAGIIAYSSVCTHQGCDLTQWLPETNTFKCYCHYSEFDATKMGKPQKGPARRRLAVLPIELNDNNELVVAAKFVGRVGFKK